MCGFSDRFQHWLPRSRWLVGVALVLFVWLTDGVHSPLVGLLILHVVLLALILPQGERWRYTGVVMLACGSVFLLRNSGDPARMLAMGGVYLLTIAAAAWLPRSLIAPLLQREQELVRLNDEHSRTLDSLQQAEKQRSQFVRVVTHELRSPVVGAQSLLRVLLANMGGTLSEQQRDILGRVSGRMDALLTLINDLLSLAAASQMENPTLHPLDLAALLAEQADTWRYQAQDKRQTITFETRPQSIMVLAEETGMKRILENLIGNALKYTPEGGQVRVSLHVEDQAAVLRVEDTGIGIPAEALAQIGEEFYRAANAKESGITGTGLGLATVRQLVERFGGEMQIASEVGKGTTFTLRFVVQDNWRE